MSARPECGWKPKLYEQEGGAGRGRDLRGPSRPSRTGVPRDFRCIDDGCYSLSLEQLGIEFVVDRLRRKWDELIGELTVRCDLAGSRGHEGVLSVLDLNFSNLRARQERARYLAERSRAPDLDWTGLLDGIRAAGADG